MFFVLGGFVGKKGKKLSDLTFRVDSDFAMTDKVLITISLYTASP
jgi:hypothetical protein